MIFKKIERVGTDYRYYNVDGKHFEFSPGKTYTFRFPDGFIQEGKLSAVQSSHTINEKGCYYVRSVINYTLYLEANCHGVTTKIPITSLELMVE